MTSKLSIPLWPGLRTQDVEALALEAERDLRARLALTGAPWPTGSVLKSMTDDFLTRRFGLEGLKETSVRAQFNALANTARPYPSNAAKSRMLDEVWAERGEYLKFYEVVGWRIDSSVFRPIVLRVLRARKHFPDLTRLAEMYGGLLTDDQRFEVLWICPGFYQHAVGKQLFAVLPLEMRNRLRQRHPGTFGHEAA